MRQNKQITHQDDENKIKGWFLLQPCANKAMFIAQFTLIYTALFAEPGRTGVRMESKSSNAGGSLRLNMDFDKPVCMLPEQYEWIASPADGVSRVPLERMSAESGHKTSFVWFSPDSCFPAHAHPLGEEIYVLDGVFSDQHGDYPAGSYLRNPPGSSHRPFTKEGCTLFVKLDQLTRMILKKWCCARKISNGGPGLAI